MIQLSQLDPKWSKATIGETAFTLGKFGCTITALCMLLSKWGFNILPPDAAKKWAFNSNGEILWTQCDFEAMKFTFRGYTNNQEEIIKAAESKDRGVILRVREAHWPLEQAHWIVVDAVELGKLVIIDPLGGKRSLLPKKYKITGYATFELIAGYPVDGPLPEHPVHWSEEDMAWMLQHGIIEQKHDPNTPVTWAELSKVSHILAKKIIGWVSDSLDKS